jgi:hypothetical protein
VSGAAAWLGDGHGAPVAACPRGKHGRPFYRRSRWAASMLRNEGRWGPNCLEVRTAGFSWCAQQGGSRRRGVHAPRGLSGALPEAQLGARAQLTSTPRRAREPPGRLWYDGTVAATPGGALECGTRWRARCRAFQPDMLRGRLL